MAEDRKSPQSFALVLGEADGGTVNRELSEVFQRLSDELDAHSFLHDAEAKGSMTIKLVIVNDHGKVAMKFDATAKSPPKKFSGARFFRTEDGDLTRQDPRVASDLCAERREEKRAKSAAVPVTAGSKVA